MNIFESTPEQIAAEKTLNAQGFKFSNWIPAQPDADGEGMTEQGYMVMVKKIGRYGREYREIAPSGAVN